MTCSIFYGVINWAVDCCGLAAVSGLPLESFLNEGISLSEPDTDALDSFDWVRLSSEEASYYCSVIASWTFARDLMLSGANSEFWDTFDDIFPRTLRLLNFLLYSLFLLIWMSLFSISSTRKLCSLIFSIIVFKFSLKNKYWSLLT